MDNLISKLLGDVLIYKSANEKQDEGQLEYILDFLGSYLGVRLSDVVLQQKKLVYVELLLKTDKLNEDRVDIFQSSYEESENENFVTQKKNLYYMLSALEDILIETTYADDKHLKYEIVETNHDSNSVEHLVVYYEKRGKLYINNICTEIGQNNDIVERYSISYVVIINELMKKKNLNYTNSAILVSIKDEKEYGKPSDSSNIFKSLREVIVEEMLKKESQRSYQLKEQLKQHKIDSEEKEVKLKENFEIEKQKTMESPPKVSEKEDTSQRELLAEEFEKLVIREEDLEKTIKQKNEKEKEYEKTIKKNTRELEEKKLEIQNMLLLQQNEKHLFEIQKKKLDEEINELVTEKEIIDNDRKSLVKIQELVNNEALQQEATIKKENELIQKEKDLLKSQKEELEKLNIRTRDEKNRFQTLKLFVEQEHAKLKDDSDNLKTEKIQVKKEREILYSVKEQEEFKTNEKLMQKELHKTQIIEKLKFFGITTPKELDEKSNEFKTKNFMTFQVDTKNAVYFIDIPKCYKDGNNSVMMHDFKFYFQKTGFHGLSYRVYRMCVESFKFIDSYTDCHYEDDERELTREEYENFFSILRKHYFEDVIFERELVRSVPKKSNFYKLIQELQVYYQV